ncbi:hypothetical protein DDW11_05795 [Sulfolobus sp. SCGC AB-777_G06]|nr:hypothetical protein DDW11_05795 [Sulfolobus sp. SCGC AB-777_G06]
MPNRVGSVDEKILRIIVGVSAAIWSKLHLTVGYHAAVIASRVVGHASLIFAMYSEYFGFNAALYLFTSYEIFTNTRKLLLPFFILFIFNTFLIIYTHVDKAPLLGKPLPIILEVYPVILLDIILLIGTGNIIDEELCGLMNIYHIYQMFINYYRKQSSSYP